MLLKPLIKTHQITAFFLLTFIISWLSWGAVALLFGKVEIASYPLFILGTFGPSIAGFGLTGLLEGRAGMGRLLRRMFQWRAGITWYVAAMFTIPAIMIAALAISVLLGNSPGTTPFLQWWLPLALPFVLVIGVLTGGPLEEEPGWRGYALPRLQALWNPLIGTLVLGAIWSCWHLPLFFIPGTSQYGLPFIFFALHTICLALFMTWIYNRTGGSLLFAMLFHASTNISFAVLPLIAPGGSPMAAYLYFALECLVVVAIVGLNWKDFTTRKPLLEAPVKASSSA